MWDEQIQMMELIFPWDSPISSTLWKKILVQPTDLSSVEIPNDLLQFIPERRVDFVASESLEASPAPALAPSPAPAPARAPASVRRPVSPPPPTKKPRKRSESMERKSAPQKTGEKSAPQKKENAEQKSAPLEGKTQETAASARPKALSKSGASHEAVRKLSKDDVKKWSSDDVARWAKEHLSLDNAAEAFQANEVDGETLLELSKEDLKEIGISSLGHYKKVLRERDAILNESGVDDDANFIPASQITLVKRIGGGAFGAVWRSDLVLSSSFSFLSFFCLPPTIVPSGTN